MEENKNVLDELNKGTTMGVDAINFVLDKVEDEKFKKVIEIQKERYDEIAKRISEIYKRYDTEDKPHETGTMTKAMTWSGIEMKTMLDKSNSKIAELLLQGTNMGIIEGKKILNNKHLDKDVSDIAKDYVAMQEKSVEELKKYL